ncbi:hypothetical protein PoB_004683600 [Plakobranchus ocellatus]|uniref:Uncharacterized protein n=1 Tax=Plakobranchus ocellatus TaxID=259542 RepID=A0AAV4BIS0_9GAST|nr:hypothetical protein PoB_004683600 [Plakobranchus ocellatus]
MHQSTSLDPGYVSSFGADRPDNWTSVHSNVSHVNRTLQSNLGLLLSSLLREPLAPNSPQQTSADRNRLQQIAIDCSRPQWTATDRNRLQQTASNCSRLQ